MEDDGESQVFETKISSIKEELRMLRDQGIIDDGTYRDFSFLTSTATTLDRLDQLSQNLTEIRQNRKQGAYNS